MKNFFFLVLTICLLLIYGCSRSSKNEDLQEIVYIVLSENFQERPFNLSEVYDEIKMIRLETNDECLMSRFRGFVGSKYILAFEKDKILQFNVEGKYLGVIAYKGNGPNEFSNVNGWDVDSKEQFFYMHDYGKNYIKKYNLRTRMFENDVPFVDKGYLNSLLLLNDDTLIAVSSRHAKYDYIYFYLSINGKILGGVKRDINTPRSDDFTWRRSSLKKGPKNSLYIMKAESDTVFKIIDSTMAPNFVLHVDKPVKSNNKTKGIEAEFSHIDQERFYITLSDMSIERNESMVFLSGTDIGKLVYDFQEKNTFFLRPILANIEGAEFTVGDISFLQNNHILFQFQAFELKSKIEEQLEKNDISEEVKVKLSRLNNEISENDNPVLFVVNTNN